MTFGSGLLADGTTLGLQRSYPNGLPKPTFVVRGDGDHYVGLLLTDPSGNPITSFTGNVTVCFNLSASEVSGATGPLTIQMWDGGKWVDVTTTFTAGTPNKLCATVSEW